MEDLGGEVAAEEPPVRAVGSRADVMLVTAYNGVRREGRRAVGENGAVLDQGLVGEGVVGDEDGGARADLEGYDWSIFDR